MLKICDRGDATLHLPAVLNSSTMYGFLGQALNFEGDAKFSTLRLDFGDAVNISPVGVVVVSNLIEYLRRCKVSGTMTGLFSSPATRYLDQSGFFERYNYKPLFGSTKPPPTQLPLHLVDGSSRTGFLFMTMMPWMSRQLERSESSLSVIRICLEEIFQNISDHSGTGVGCVCAEYHQHQKSLEIVISDFGRGIPDAARQKLPPWTSDSVALKAACEKGFTTGSNVRNRGWGLHTLINHVTSVDRGRVQIASGRGELSAIHAGGGSKIGSRTRAARYPGTMVRVILKAESIQELEAEIAKEEFSW